MTAQTIGPYRVIREVGKGGMGAVYEAIHPQIERKVAIKVLHPQYAVNEQVVQRFFNERLITNVRRYVMTALRQGMGWEAGRLPSSSRSRYPSSLRHDDALFGPTDVRAAVRSGLAVFPVASDGPAGDAICV